MNVGYDKYHPVGPTCTYKGKKVPCLVEISMGGGTSGHILMNLLRYLDALKLYENDILPMMFVDGNGSSFDMEFLPYICDKNHKWTVVFGVPYETSLWKVGDSEEQNGT